MAKRFLASVANVELFERINGKLQHFASAHTLTDSSIGFQISMEDVRGGQGAKLFGRFGHTTGMTLQMTDAMFDINYLRLNLGAQANTTTDVTSVLVEGEQQIVGASGGITLKNIATYVGHLCGLDKVVCWAHKASCEGTSSDRMLTIEDDNKTITQDTLKSQGFAKGDILSVSYFKNDPSAILFDVSATFIPGEVMAVMTANEYAGDSANVTTGDVVGQLVVKIPRLQLDGQFDLGLNMTSAATISLNGSALATIDPLSGKEYYAEVLETKHEGDGSDWRFGLTQLIIDRDKAVAGSPIVVYAVYGDKIKQISMDDLADQVVKHPGNADGDSLCGIFIKSSATGQYVRQTTAPTNWENNKAYCFVAYASNVSDTDYTAMSEDDYASVQLIEAEGVIDGDDVTLGALS